MLFRLGYFSHLWCGEAAPLVVKLQTPLADLQIFGPKNVDFEASLPIFPLHHSAHSALFRKNAHKKARSSFGTGLLYGIPIIQELLNIDNFADFRFFKTPKHPSTPH